MSKLSLGKSIKLPNIFNSSAPEMLENLLNEGKSNICVSAPTGIGKSVSINLLLAKIAKKDKKCIAESIIPSRVAVSALYSYLNTNFKDYGSFNYAMKNDKSNNPIEGSVTIMTAGYWLERCLHPSTFERYKKASKVLLFVDETHDQGKETGLAIRLAYWIEKKLPNVQIILSSATLNLSHIIITHRPTCIDVIEQEGVYNVTVSQPTELAIYNTPVFSNNVEVVFFEESAKYGPIHSVLSNETINGRIKWAVNKAVQEGKNEKDILLIVPGKKEIENVIEMLEADSRLAAYNVYAVHSEIDSLELKEYLNDFNKPRILVSTNITENSLTIDRLMVVIDTAMRKVATIDRDGITQLTVVNASQANLVQAAGRVGR